jgi:hypothetical protein
MDRGLDRHGDCLNRGRRRTTRQLRLPRSRGKSATTVCRACAAAWPVLRIFGKTLTHLRQFLAGWSAGQARIGDCAWWGAAGPEHEVSQMFAGSADIFLAASATSAAVVSRKARPLCSSAPNPRSARKHLHVVRSFRDGRKVKQEVLCTLGRLDRRKARATSTAVVSHFALRRRGQVYQRRKLQDRDRLGPRPLPPPILIASPPSPRAARGVRQRARRGASCRIAPAARRTRSRRTCRALSAARAREC